jgi:hypothetical protein
MPHSVTIATSKPTCNASRPGLLLVKSLVLEKGSNPLIVSLVFIKFEEILLLGWASVLLVLEKGSNPLVVSLVLIKLE